MIAQGLPAKHCSSGPHSSPRGQGTAVAQFWVCSIQEVPQKFELMTGDLDGDEEIGAFVGDDVVDDGMIAEMAGSELESLFEDVTDGSLSASPGCERELVG